jgi:hypothetical protein
MVARQEEEREKCGSFGIKKKEEEKEERRGLVKVFLVDFCDGAINATLSTRFLGFSFDDRNLPQAHTSGPRVMPP